MKQYAYFSAAIRDGAKLGPQIFVSYQNEQGTCAVGAGLLAMFCDRAYADMVSIYRTDMLGLFPYMQTTAQCPARAKWWQIWRLPICICQRRGGTYSLVRTCEHLNDFHDWTREMIADWLYAEEEKLGFVTVVETEAHKIPADKGENTVTLEECFVPVLTERF